VKNVTTETEITETGAIQVAEKRSAEMPLSKWVKNVMTETQYPETDVVISA